MKRSGIRIHRQASFCQRSWSWPSMSLFPNSEAVRTNKTMRKGRRIRRTRLILGMIWARFFMITRIPRVWTEWKSSMKKDSVTKKLKPAPRSPERWRSSKIKRRIFKPHFSGKGDHVENFILPKGNLSAYGSHEGLTVGEDLLRGKHGSKASRRQTAQPLHNLGQSSVQHPILFRRQG